MTTFERAVLQNLVAVVGAVTDIIMQDKLVNGLFEFLVSLSRVINLVFGIFACGCIVQLWIVL